MNKISAFIVWDTILPKLKAKYGIDNDRYIIALNNRDYWMYKCLTTK